MKVRNRSTGTVVYSVPDFNVRREFAPGEIKEIPQKELAALIQRPGGKNILIKYLQVNREDIKTLDIARLEPEYFYSGEDVRRIMTLGSQDEFLDMLDFAPAGVINMIKDYAIKLPLSDLRKIEALRKKTGFDTTRALENIKNENGEVEIVEAPKRRVSAETASDKPARRTTPEYKVISDN